MKASDFWMPTRREVSQETVSASHQWMIRSGMIKPIGSGLYAWLPLGFRILRKLQAWIRLHMDEVAQEILLPALHPAEIWQKSKRLEKYGPELFLLKDRRQKTFVLAPTHEECVTMMMQGTSLKSQELPKVFYQIQTKFRDEKRPRFGVIRGREFLMKDAYSFHANESCLQETYRKIACAYQKIFKGLGLDYLQVSADSAAMGGSFSEEFHAKVKVGEDRLAKWSQASEFFPLDHFSNPRQAIAASQVAPCLMITEGAYGKKTAWFLDAHSEISANKCRTLCNTFPEVMAELKPFQQDLSTWLLESAQENIHIFVDHRLETWWHDKSGISFEKSTALEVAHQITLSLKDFIHASKGNVDPEGRGALEIVQGLEIGHIFQLQCVYSETFDLHVQQADGSESPVWMGCYGIGVSRLLAALIEQGCASNKPMVWPEPLAPFQVVIIEFDTQGEARERIQAASKQLLEQLQNQNIEVFLENRPITLGRKFKEIELMGIPYWVVLGKNYLSQNQVEICHASNQALKHHCHLNDVVDKIQAMTQQTRAT